MKNKDILPVPRGWALVRGDLKFAPSDLRASGVPHRFIAYHPSHWMTTGLYAPRWAGRAYHSLVTTPLAKAERLR